MTHYKLLFIMKQKSQFIFFSILTLLLLSACTNRNFIPLYKDEKPIEQTALLTAPIQVDLIYHNNQRKNLTPPYKPMVNYRLLPGKHLLGFQYQDLHTNEDNDQEVITSKIVLLRFVAEPGKIYKINFNKPENYIAAKKLEEHFQISLYQDNQLIATSTPAAEKLYENSLFSDNTFSKSTEELFQENDIKLGESRLPPGKNDMPIQHLKYWWINASKTEQENFREWVKSN